MLPAASQPTSAGLPTPHPVGGGGGHPAGGPAHASAPVQAGRKVEKNWYRIGRDVLRSGESLGRWRGALLRQAHRCKKEKKQARYECTPHLEPLSIRSVFPLDIRP